jgi:integrase/recombinase XerC
VQGVLSLLMLLIFRRHKRDCRFTTRRQRSCQCPIAVEGKLHGEMIRRSLDVRSWDAAQKIVREWESGQRVSPTVEEASKRFIEDLNSRGLSKDTVKKFELLTGELSNEFPKWTVSRFTPDNLGKFREQWKVSPSTAAKKLERLRSFFKFCVDRKWTESNPGSSLKPPKEIAIVKKPYDAWELEKIEWAIPLFPIKGIYGEVNRDRIRAFVSVLKWTGLRIRDVVQLKQSMVGEFITLRTHKNGKPVQLPVHPEMTLALKKMPPGEYFFWSGDSNPKSCVGDWQRTLRRLGAIAGVHIHAHRWRHTFITTLLSKGVPLSEVAAIAGNSPRIIEKNYNQWVQQRQQSINSAVRQTWAVPSSNESS